jgi:hypothetical protein
MRQRIGSAGHVQGTLLPSRAPATGWTRRERRRPREIKGGRNKMGGEKKTKCETNFRCATHRVNLPCCRLSPVLDSRHPLPVGVLLGMQDWVF